MTEDRDRSAEEESTQGSQGPVGGERLAVARREQQISVLEVAKELHLDEPKVRALERNEFDVLGAPVFAKGHLRKYAQLVGVDPDDVFADYYRLTRSEGIPPIVVGRRRVRRELSPGPWITVIIAIIAVVTAYWWFVARDPGPRSDSAVPAPTEQPEAASEPDAVTAVDAAGAIDTAADTEEAEEPLEDAPSEAATEADDTVALAAAAPEEQPVSQPPAVEGQLRLSLTFTGDCWTEIRDGDGRRLFFGMGRAGRTAELMGSPPLSVLFGNADNVSVKVNGNNYPVPAVNPSNRTAQLTIRNP